MCVCLMMISNKSQKQLKKKKKNLVRLPASTSLLLLYLSPPSREFKYRFISYIFCPADLAPTHLCPCPSVGAARPSCPIIIIIIMTTPTRAAEMLTHTPTRTHAPHSRFTPTNNAWRGRSSSSASSASSASYSFSTVQNAKWPQRT